jgi:elongation factor P
MIPACELRNGAVVRLDGAFYKVVESVGHAGGGRAGAMVHAKLRELSTGRVIERRWNTDDKVDEAAVERVTMQMLFREGDVFTFMNPRTYDQIPIPAAIAGPAAAFLKENDECEIEFFESKPLSLHYAPTVDMTVSSTGQGLKGRTESTLKEAVLDNGMTALVPQFIKEGDRVRIEVETGKYLDRVTEHETKGAKFTTAAAPQRAEPKAPPKTEAPEKSRTKPSKTDRS